MELVNCLNLLLYVLMYSHTVDSTNNKLLLVAFDGFRWDYLQYVDTPNFDKIIASGAKPPYMDGVYPTVTAPAFYSIATGLYPESHGIINNEMYDPVLNSSFTDPITKDPAWFEAEPIWVTAEKNGLKTGCYYFPGVIAKIDGYQPNYFVPFNTSIKFKDRADTVIKWLVEDDVDFSILYFFDPDLTAHRTGPAPESAATLQKIKDCDTNLGYLLDKMAENHLREIVNIIVLSDHGFTSITQLVNLYEYVDHDDIFTVKFNNILPKEGRLDKVYSQLQKMPNVTVYKKEDIPERYHYQHNRRILPLVLMPNEGVVITKSETFSLKGSHGYDNSLMSMKPFFVAVGPDIKENFTSPVFSQLDVYSLMCKLLNIKPNANNGSLETIGQILQLDNHIDYPPKPIFSDKYVLITITCSGAVLCLALFGIIYMVAKRRPAAPSPNNGAEVTYSKVPAEYLPL